VIKFEFDFKDLERFNTLIRYVEDNILYGELQIQTQILAHHTADRMIDTINANRKRPDKGTHDLENNILAEQISTTGGVEYGIGRISSLIAKAPYFEMLNDGATYTTKVEHVVPFEDGFRTYKVGSSHTIAGINYVGIAIYNLDRDFRELIEKAGVKWLGDMGK
jgi:hypothetical protein